MPLQEVQDCPILQLPEANVVLDEAIEALAWKLTRTSTRHAIFREKPLVTQVVMVDPDGGIKVIPGRQQIVARVTEDKGKRVPSAIYILLTRPEGKVMW